MFGNSHVCLSASQVIFCNPAPEELTMGVFIEVQQQLGFGVPYFNTFFLSLYFFLPGYLKAQAKRFKARSDVGFWLLWGVGLGL